ncbi:MAG: hypothetical protein QCI00_05355 [Candidatus Thermoplasmatota archaeon]|nr:hypothetical protein [Candidatus Thermoplasmatota archaeon]
MVKITLDEQSIDALVQYAKKHPDDIRNLIKIVGEEMLSVLMEKDMLDKGALLYREIQSAINYTYQK